jgi:hypothetical protein
MTTSIPQEQTKTAPAEATTKPRVAKRPAHVAPSKAKPATPARRGTKTVEIFDLLKRSGGVTLKELMKATGWQAHSVRGFLSGVIRKKMGIRAESSKQPDGGRSYHISSK